MKYKAVKFSGIYDTRVPPPPEWIDSLWRVVITDFRLSIETVENLQWVMRFSAVPYGEENG